VLKEAETFAEAKVTPDRMTAVLIQVKCLKNAPGPASRAELCSVGLPRGGCTTGLNPALDYISVLIEMRDEKDVGLQIEAWTRDSLRSKYALNPDDKQLSFVVRGARPSHFLGSAAGDATEIDEAFNELMTARLDPLLIKNSSKQAKENLKLSIPLVYKK
jgi:hypothetical protein